MGNTTHTGNTQGHSFRGLRTVKPHDLLKKMILRIEKNFTLAQVISNFLGLLIVSLLVFFIIPMFFIPPTAHDMNGFTGFWMNQTGDPKVHDRPDAPGLLASLGGTQAALIALIIFRDTRSAAHTQDDYNNQHKTDAIQVVIIILAFLSQILLSMEMPRLIGIMKVWPGWILAFVFSLVNLIALLSISDYAAWVKNAARGAEHQKKQYVNWKAEHSKFVPASGHPWIRTMWLPCVIDFFYFALTFLPFVQEGILHASTPLMSARAIGMLVSVFIVCALLISLFTVVPCLFIFLGASSSGDYTYALPIAVVLLILPLLINLSILLSTHGLWKCLQVVAFLIAILNIVLLLTAKPRPLTLPYLMVMCDIEIEIQDSILSSANSTIGKWENDKTPSTDTVDAAVQTPVTGHQEEIMEDAGGGYYIINDGDSPRSRYDTRLIHFGLCLHTLFAVIAYFAVRHATHRSAYRQRRARVRRSAPPRRHSRTSTRSLKATGVSDARSST